MSLLTGLQLASVYSLLAAATPLDDADAAAPPAAPVLVNAADAAVDAADAVDVALPASVAVAPPVATATQAVTPVAAVNSAWGDQGAGVGMALTADSGLMNVADIDRRAFGPLWLGVFGGTSMGPAYADGGFVYVGGVARVMVIDEELIRVSLTGRASATAPTNSRVDLTENLLLGAAAGVAVDVPIAARLSLRAASDLLFVAWSPWYESTAAGTAFVPSLSLRVAL